MIALIARLIHMAKSTNGAGEAPSSPGSGILAPAWNGEKRPLVAAPRSLLGSAICRHPRPLPLSRRIPTNNEQ